MNQLMRVKQAAATRITEKQVLFARADDGLKKCYSVDGFVVCRSYNGNIIQLNVEILSPGDQVSLNVGRNLSTAAD